MAATTKIAWANATFNPWIGCSKVHTGCEHCYAEAYGKRFGVKWGPDGTRRKTAESTWREPLQWERESRQFSHWANWHRPRVFPSLCDPFEEFDGPIVDRKGQWISHIEGACEIVLTLDDLRRDFFNLIDRTPNLDWLLLTKRPENVREMWEEKPQDLMRTPCDTDHRENCWLLYSASDQATLEAGVTHLLACRDLVPVLGVSLEPLIGPVDLKLATPCDRNCNEYTYAECPGTDGPCLMQRTVDWVIVGGESGPNARPCDVAWIRSVVRQCAEAGVPVFVKQLGANVIHTGPDPRLSWPVDAWDASTRRVTLSHPKGGEPAEWPEGLRGQELPTN